MHARGIILGIILSIIFAQQLEDKVGDLDYLLGKQKFPLSRGGADLAGSHVWCAHIQFWGACVFSHRRGECGLHLFASSETIHILIYCIKDTDVPQKCDCVYVINVMLGFIQVLNFNNMTASMPVLVLVGLQPCSHAEVILYASLIGASYGCVYFGITMHSQDPVPIKRHEFSLHTSKSSTSARNQNAFTITKKHVSQVENESRWYFAFHFFVSDVEHGLSYALPISVMIFWCYGTHSGFADITCWLPAQPFSNVQIVYSQNTVFFFSTALFVVL